MGRADQFMKRFGLKLPILMAPMAGACPPALARAVAAAGGMGATGALLDSPEAIEKWVAEFRRGDFADWPLQMNLWIPDPVPQRDTANETAVCEFLGQWGAQVAPDAFKPDAGPSFDEQCEALLAARPTVISSIMGLYPKSLVDRMHDRQIAWFACVTTVDEARAAVDAGADVVVAQGAEAGGHRGAFDAANGADQAAGLFALLPQVVDAVDVPVVATGGIADARGVAAAMMLGASAVQIGSAFLRSDESSVASAWADAIGSAQPNQTRLTRAFSGRWGRAVATDYVISANSAETPEPAPYPVQRALTAQMRKQGTETNDISRIQAWAGQSSALARTGPAGNTAIEIWAQATKLLNG
jgi:nitronate monooxygenase